MERIRIVALSGSLRRASYNTAVVTALKQLAPENVDLMIYKGIGELPLFNPDIEGQAIPALDDLRRILLESDGLLIASPEYAHGISGVLKNALDWLVSGEEFVNKPVVLINTSPRASYAQNALREVITTMSGIIIEKACISIQLLGSNLDAAGIVNEPNMRSLLKVSLEEFCKSITEINHKMQQ